MFQAWAVVRIPAVPGLKWPAIHGQIWIDESPQGQRAALIPEERQVLSALLEALVRPEALPPQEALVLYVGPVQVYPSGCRIWEEY